METIESAMLVCWSVEISQATNSDCVVCLQSLVASLNQPKQILKDLFSETIQRSKTPRHWLLHTAFEETRRFSKYLIFKWHNTNKYLEKYLEIHTTLQRPQRFEMHTDHFPEDGQFRTPIIARLSAICWMISSGRNSFHQIPFGSYQIQQKWNA